MVENNLIYRFPMLRSLCPSEEAMGWQFFTKILGTDVGHRSLKILADWVTSEREISLDGFKYFDHDGILWLALLANYLKMETGMEPIMRLPSDDRQLDYIFKLGIERVAANVFKMANYPYPAPELDLDSRWAFSVLNIVNERSLPRIYNHIDRFTREPLAKLLGVDIASEEVMHFGETLRISLEETCRNIAEHSQRPTWTGYGYAIMRSMPPGYPIIRLAVGDIGIGLRNRLNDMGYSPGNDGHAIRLALLLQYLGGARKEEPLRRGEGLFDVIKYTVLRRGSVTIRSGQSIGHLDLSRTGIRGLPSDSQTKRIIERKLVLGAGYHFPGVQVTVDFASPKYLDLDQPRKEYQGDV